MRRLLIVFLVCLMSCHKGITQHPIHFKNIPEQAFWIGGADGGNWYLVKDISRHKNVATIAVYNDNDGNLIVSKQFALICNFNTDKDPIYLNDIKNQIDYFDGEKIYIKSSPGKLECYLK